MIERLAKKKVLELSSQFKSVAIMGPRQSGKTTLAKMCFPEQPYVSLENPENRNFALADPVGFLKKYPDGAVFDEIQRAPQILSYLQQILDEGNQKGKFILTGSNNLLMLEQITQTLAGRVAYVDLLPYSMEEVGRARKLPTNVDELIFNGGYPPIQSENIPPGNWFPAYVRTYVERDVRQIRNIENLLIFEKLLSLCAGRVGQMLNFSNLANETGMDVKTVQAWVGVLQASYIVYLLPPYFKNFNKRIVKTPKLYFYDTGLASYLLQIQNTGMLAIHPYRGALFENFIINEMLKNRYNQGKRSNLFYWQDHAGNEIDVLVDNGLELKPYEIKSGQTMSSTYFKNLVYWEKLTGNSNGTVIYGGDDNHTGSKGYSIVSWKEVAGF
ncbi:MAG TPA: ATP-binding protein [Bacteroidetes bacterium]|nr:ATP-binding protein [Bacteroidota bacterium]